MASAEDRRAPGAMRIPFDALVEVGGALGPSFEAHAVNLSEEGMLLRTTYLPEPGQPLTCRFDSGGQTVLASGEVVWVEGAQEGGEFAIRFTEMDPESVEALRRACGVAAAATGDATDGGAGENAGASAAGGADAAKAAAVTRGSKVRLHIDGLASPMRAKIRDAKECAVTVGSDLGFLQVGKQLDLEDAASGSKRAAKIDRVDVQVDPASRVPQLVVTLRYDDAPADAPAAATSADAAEVDEATGRMKGALARGLARVGPAFERLAARTKTTIALLAQRRREKADAAAPRRTTAPPPGGGLHATGRRVVRGDSGGGAGAGEEAAMDGRFKVTKRKAMVAGAVMLVAIVGAVALKKSHHDPAGADGAETAAAAAATAAGAATGAPLSPVTPTSMPPLPVPAAIDDRGGPGAMAAGGALGPIGAAGDDPSDPSKAHKKHGKVVPFGNGPVHHGNVLHLKMDGPIDSIEGAQQPTGFAVKIPGRKSVEAAGPLAARDARIAAIKVSNDAAGAELVVNFKDGVPNYQVSAKGDTLILSLAPAGALGDKTVAKKDAKGGKNGGHAKPEHEKKKH